MSYKHLYLRNFNPMNDLNRANADAILRTLYNLKSNGMEEFWIVCDTNQISKDEGERLFDYLKAKGYLKVMGKVGNGDIYVRLSDNGLRFFAEDNLVNQYARTFAPSATPVQTFHIAGNAANFGNSNGSDTTNTTTQLENPEPKEEKWYSKFLHDTSTQIVSGLTIAAILALIAWYFSQPK